MGRALHFVFWFHEIPCRHSHPGYYPLRETPGGNATPPRNSNILKPKIWKSAITRTSDPIRPTRRVYDPNRPTGVTPGDFSLCGVTCSYVSRGLSPWEQLCRRYMRSTECPSSLFCIYRFADESRRMHRRWSAQCAVYKISKRDRGDTMKDTLCHFVGGWQWIEWKKTKLLLLIRHLDDETRQAWRH